MNEDLTSYENLVVRILADKQSACALDIATVLYPGEAELRPKISQVSVVLRRLEKKGVVLEAGKNGKKVTFRLVSAVAAETEAVSLEPISAAVPSEGLYNMEEETETVIGDAGWPKVRILNIAEHE